MLELNTSNCTPFLPKDWLTSRLDALESARVKLEEGSGLGGAYTGWVHLPRDYDKEEFARIQAAAERIRSDSQALVVIGIGGSYLGARAVVELLHSPNFNLTHKGGPDIYFAGNGLSSDAMLEVIELVKDKDFSINVISKSGTTTEPAVAFRIFKALLEEKYGKEGARRRIYATTDAHKGALKGLADAEGYEEFVVPDAVGGRYSVLTAVGLLPIACAGVDIAALMEGAAQAMEALPPPVRTTRPGSTPPPATPCIPRARRWKSWWGTSPPSASSASGGNSSSARPRARTARPSSPPAWSSPPICTPWASTSSRVSA